MDNEKMFDLMTKMYSEMQEGFTNVSEQFKEVKDDIAENRKEIKEIKRTVINIEQDHGKKLEALFDGYTQNSEKLNRIEQEVSKHEEIILRRIK